MGDLIENLYTPEECKFIRHLYKDDPSIHRLLYKTFAQKIISESDKFISSKPLDVLCFICMSSSFAHSETECQTVAVIVYRQMRSDNPLPSIVGDTGLLFAEKTLTSLAFFKDALKNKMNRYGAPKPEYYRGISKEVFKRYDHKDIAENHEKWEMFLNELLIT